MNTYKTYEDARAFPEPLGLPTGFLTNASMGADDLPVKVHGISLNSAQIAANIPVRAFEIISIRVLFSKKRINRQWNKKERNIRVIITIRINGISLAAQSINKS